MAAEAVCFYDDAFLNRERRSRQTQGGDQPGGLWTELAKQREFSLLCGSTRHLGSSHLSPRLRLERSVPATLS